MRANIVLGTACAVKLTGVDRVGESRKRFSLLIGYGFIDVKLPRRFVSQLLEGCGKPQISENLLG